MKEVSFSVVTYYTPLEDLRKLTESIKQCTFDYAFTVVDNSSQKYIKGFCKENNVSYLDPGSNIGFGAAHNLVLVKYQGSVKYHIVINPDVYFNPNTFEPLLEFMATDSRIGLCTPKILYPNESTQHLCKLIPSPMDLLGRRFLPVSIQKAFGLGSSHYEMRNFDYDQQLEVPVLSGCCMVLSNEALMTTGLFDDRYFLYLEDVDLSRRIYENYRNVHFPEVSIFHAYQKSSYKNVSATKLHVTSALKYFNKWGWLYDRKRRKLNQKAIEANLLKSKD